MVICFLPSGTNMTHILLVALLVTVLMEHGISGARCRFDSTSATRETCIFPCRCAKGCDQVSGQCLDDGQCKDGYPSGYNWRGTACQIGNVALYKTTTHSTGKWGDIYPSSQAVDGAIDPLSYKHCAVPNAMLGTDVWWKVDFGGNYRISRVIIYNSDTVVDAPQCPAIDMRGRDRCGAAGISELDCQIRGCCWDGEARGSDIACYRKQCKAGYFGWRCRFKCHKCSTCDSVTGECPTTCQDDRWGVGCMLSSNCYYDNQKGFKYMGRTNSHGSFRCMNWTNQTRKVDSMFPEGSRAAAKNYCRNPDNGRSPWCFYYGGTILQWTYCNVNACACNSGRFDVNCEKECHCKNIDENCQSNTPKGRCLSGCASHFTGPTCQECKDAHFGVFCDGTCHCGSGSCNKATGHCPSGCAVGWSGDNCQKDERRLSTFTLSVGNSAGMNDHSQCASHNGAMTAGPTVNESCTATGRYLSFRRTGGGENHWTTLCEVVVIGHRYVSCQQCPSTCNVVIGCDVCAPGKQQPDCVHDCDDGNYGVNCNESCGHCKKHSKCSITNGSCSKGCENWYISDVCKTYIASPGFHSSVKPDVDDVTTTSATVSWPRASNISTGLGGHYYYVLWLQADGESSKNITRVEQSAGEQRMEAQITGLTADTAYSLRVEPYRQHNGERGGGTATGVTRFKTRPTDSAPLQTTECAAQCAAALGTGAWIGIAVGTFLLGLVTMALLLLGIPRLRQSSGNAGKERQGMEMSSRYNTDEAVEDAHGYVIPPTKVPKEEGGVVDDASGYYNVASESRQPESHNVYDVIQT